MFVCIFLRIFLKGASNSKSYVEYKKKMQKK